MLMYVVQFCTGFVLIGGGGGSGRCGIFMEIKRILNKSNGKQNDTVLFCDIPVQVVPSCGC